MTVTYSDDNYGEKTNTTKFNISKAKSNVTVSTTNISRGYNETIIVSLPEYEHATGNISVTITDKDNTIIESYIINYQEMDPKVEVNTSIIENLANGTYTVSVKFTNDTNYNDSIATSTFNVSLPIITIIADRNLVYVDDYITLHGYVRNSDNITRVTEGEIIVRIGELTSYTTTLTDYETGTNRKYDKEGEYIANATYILNGQEIVTSQNIVLKVNRIPTITTVKILNNTLGNVLIDVVVKENGTSHSDYITEGIINVTVEIDGQTRTYPISTSNTTIKLDQITTTGDIKVSVVYNGSYKYENSTGRDADNIEEVFEIIPVIAKSSNLTINVIPENVGINQSVIITGQVFDEMGNVIESGKVSMSVDGKEAQVIDIEEGRYSLINTNTTHSGNIPVKVTYLGEYDGDKVLVNPSVNETTFQVDKLSTNTTVKVVSNLVGNVTINVTVKNETGQVIPQGVLNITVAGHKYSYNYDLTTQSEDNILINLSDIDELSQYLKAGDVNVEVAFNEDEVYLSSIGQDEEGNDFKIITVVKQDVNLTVTSNITTPALIGQHVNITGNLTDAMKNPIKDTLILLNITGIDDLVPVWTNSTGGFSYDYTATQNGTITVNATFTDNTNTYNNASNKTEFIVGKIATKTNVTIVNPTIGNVTIHVNVTDNSDSPVTKGHVKVYDNVTGVLIGEGDLINGGTNITLNVSTPGQIGINVTYIENDIYLPSNATDSGKTPGSPDENTIPIEVIKQNSTITINIQNNNVTIGEEVFIWGTVTDGMGQLIPTGEVNITINSTDYTVPVEKGSYNFTTNILPAGTYTINATYLGNTNISNKTSNNLDLTVNKIPTNTTIRILNNTAGNVTIEISVTNTTGVPVTTGNITVTFSNGTFIKNETVTDGKVIITIPAENTDTLLVNVTYIENDHYYPSNGRNNTEDVPENTTKIIINKQDVTITIEVNESSVQIGQTVQINGTITDSMNNPVTSGNVTILIDGDEYDYTLNGVDNTYKIENVTIKAGTITVNATYNGSAKYNNATSENREFTIDKIPTKTNVTVTNTTVGNVTLNITVEDDEGNIIKNGKVNITLNGQEPLVVDLSGDNSTVVKLLGNITSAGVTGISVEYVGNETYMPSTGINTATGEELKNITVTQRDSRITVGVSNTSVDIGQNITINGTLVDEMNNPIVNATVIVNIDGTNYTAKTNESGRYVLEYTPNKVGNITVNVTFEGNDNYTSSSEKSSFNATKIDTITNIESILSNRTGNVTLAINVTNSTGELVNTGYVEVIDAETGKLLGEGILKGDGKVNITLRDVTELGDVKVNVTYVGNDIYLPSNARSYPAGVPGVDENTTTITVVTDPLFTIGLDKDNVTIGEKVNITGILLNSTGQPYPDGKIIVTINGTNYTADYNRTTGEFSLVNVTNVPGEYIINATYVDKDGNEVFTSKNTEFRVNLIPTVTTTE